MTRETNFNETRISEKIKKIREEKRKQEDRMSEQNGFWYLESDVFPKFKAKVGDNFIRVMPAIDENHDHEYPIFVHYGIGAKDNKGAFLCPKKMKEEPCPICEESQRLSKIKDNTNAKMLWPKARTLLFVIDRDNEDVGVQLYDAPTPTVGEPILFLGENRKTGEVVKFTDINEGYDVEFIRTGDSPINTRYTGVQLSHDKTPMGNLSLLDDLEPFENLLIWSDYETMKERMMEGFKGTDEPQKKTTEIKIEKEEISEVSHKSEDELPEFPSSEEKPQHADTEKNRCTEGLRFGIDFGSSDACLDKCSDELYEDCESHQKRLSRRKARQLQGSN
jgi:hypothetical protein